MPSSGASLESTSGAGFDFETHVGAWVMVHMLSGQPVLGSQRPPTRVAFQTKNAGWGLVDDLLIWFGDAADSARLALSVKKINVLKSSWRGSELTEVVDAAIGFTRDPGEVGFRPDRDRVGLVGQDLTPSRLEEARRVLQRASAMQPDRFATEYTTRWAMNDTARDYIDAVRERLPGGAPWNDVVEVLRCLHLESFSFLRRGSDDDNRAIDWCQRLTREHSRESGQALWAVLLAEAGRLRRSGGSVDTDELVRRVRGRAHLASVLEHETAWAWLKRRTDAWLREIRGALPDGQAAPRADLARALRDRLANRKVVTLEGESGVGKSALVKGLVATLDLHQVVVLDALSLQDIAEARCAWPGLLDLPAVLGASRVARQLVVVDSAEGLDDRSWRLVHEVVAELERAQSSWYMVLTTRPGSVEHELARLAEQVDDGAFERTTVPLLSTAELGELLGPFAPSGSGGTHQAQPHPVLGNLKKLSLLQRNTALRVDGVVGDSDVLWAFVKGSEPVHPHQAPLTGWATRMADEHRDWGARTELDQDVRRALEGSGVVWDDEGRLRFTHDLYGDWCRALWLLARLDEGHLEQLTPKVGNPWWDRAIRLVSTVLVERGRWTEWQGLWGHASAVPRLQHLVLDGLLLAVKPDTRLSDALGPTLQKSPAAVGDLLARLVATRTQPSGTARSPAGAAALHRGGALSQPIEFAWIPCIRLVLGMDAPFPIDALDALSMVTMLWLEEPGRAHARDLARLFLNEACTLTNPDREPRLVGRAGKALYLAGLLALRELDGSDSAVILRWAGLGRRPPRDDEHGIASQSTLLGPDSASPGTDHPVTAWGHAPSKWLDPSFIEAVHDVRGAQALLQVDPGLLRDVLLATLLEPVDEYEGHHPGWGTGAGLHQPPKLPLVPYVFPPLALLLSADPDLGLDLVCTILNHSTACWWHERHVRTTNHHGAWTDQVPPIEQAPDFRLVVEGEARRFYGDQLVSLWNLGHGGVVPTMVLATLEAWVEADEDRLQLAASHFLGRCQSAAALGSLVMFARMWPHRLDDSLSPLLSSPTLLHGFHGMEDKYLHAFLYGGGTLAQATLSWFNRDHRHKSIQAVVFGEFVGRSLAWPAVERARQGWIEQREDTDEDWLRHWIDVLSERFDPGRWTRREDDPDGSSLVHHPDPETAARSRWAFQPANALLQIFTLTQQLRDVGLSQGIASDQVDALWALVACDAVPDGLMETAWQERLQELRTTFSAVLLRHHAAWLEQQPERLNLARAWFNTGLLSCVREHWRMHTLIQVPLAGGTDLVVGIDGLCRHWWSEPDTRELLARFLCRCHVGAMMVLSCRLAEVLTIEDMGRISHLVGWAARIDRLLAPADFYNRASVDWTPAVDRVCSAFATGRLDPRFGDWAEFANVWPEGVDEPSWWAGRGRPDGLTADLVAASMWWIPSALVRSPLETRDRLTQAVEHLVALVLADVERSVLGPQHGPGGELTVSEAAVVELAGGVALAHPDARVGIAICKRWIDLDPRARSYSDRFLLTLYRIARDGDCEPAFARLVTTLFADAFSPGGWALSPVQPPTADLLVALAGLGLYEPDPDEQWPTSRSELARALVRYWPAWIRALVEGWADPRWVSNLLGSPAFAALDEAILAWLTEAEEVVARLVGCEGDRHHFLRLLRVIAMRSAPHRSLDARVRGRFASLLTALVQTGDADSAAFAQTLTAPT